MVTEWDYGLKFLLFYAMNIFKSSLNSQRSSSSIVMKTCALIYRQPYSCTLGTEVISMREDVIKMAMQVISTQNSGVKCIQDGSDAGR